MSEPIPAAELAAFRDVVNQATPGPWVAPMRGFDITTKPDERGFCQTIVIGTYEDSVEEVDTIDTPGTREFIAQSREMCVRLLDEVDRLKTWDGLMSVLDEHYPADVFDGSSGDPGSRIVSLTREVERLKAALAAKGGE